MCFQNYFFAFFPSETGIGDGNVRARGAVACDQLITFFKVAFQHYAGHRACPSAVLFHQGFKNRFLELDIFVGVSVAAIDEESLPKSGFGQF